MSPNKLRKTSIFLPPNMVHSNILRQYILSCLVALLLYVKVINIIINNNNMSSTTPTLIGTGGKTVRTTRFNVSARAKFLAEATSVVCKQADRLALSSADKEKSIPRQLPALIPSSQFFIPMMGRSSWSSLTLCQFSLFCYSSA